MRQGASDAESAPSLHGNTRMENIGFPGEVRRRGRAIMVAGTGPVKRRLGMPPSPTMRILQGKSGMSERSVPSNGIVISSATVQPEWLDYNGHMNVAYYLVAFETGIDAYKDWVGMDLDYIAREQRSTVALESHITYQNEAMLGDALRVETRILDFDGKRAHIYQELYRDNSLLATQEVLSISFDTAARRTCPFPEPVAARYLELLEAQRALTRPDWVGRSIGIRRGKPGS